MIRTITLAKPFDAKLEKALITNKMPFNLRKDNHLEVEHKDYDLVLSVCGAYMPQKQVKKSADEEISELKKTISELLADVEKLKGKQ
jgi:hypothetical protein